MLLLSHFSHVQLFATPWTVAQVAPGVKNLPSNEGDTRDSGRSLDQEAPLEKEMATHSSILAWEIPWTEKPDVI